MNVLVLLFFLHNVLAAALLGVLFARKKDVVFKNFGVALIFDAIAFAIWSLAVITRPENLEGYVTTGVVFLLISLIFMLKAGTQQLSSSTKNLAITIGVLFAGVLFYLRTFAYPSAPSFSQEGLFFFNLHPVAQLLYVFGLTLVMIPAIEAVASKFSSAYGALVRYGFIVQVAGGIMLITSSNVAALYATGWAVGTAYLALWGTLLFRKEAWPQ